jgi:hypothetical protein
MTLNEALRLVAGIMILISLFLAVTYSQNWLWFTAFIGINLLQSSFTKWCLMMTILKKFGLKARVSVSKTSS